METSLTVFFGRILKLGATAYGGPGMLGQIKKACVNQYGWVTEGDFLRGLALCQIIPGATMVQIVTCIGYRLNGVWGALIAPIAFVLPAFVALLILSILYFNMHTLWFVQALFKGLGAIVVAIILDACITFGRSIVKDWKTGAISALSFLGFLFRLNILLILVGAAVAALFLNPKRSLTKAEAPPELSFYQQIGQGSYLILFLIILLMVIALILCQFIHPAMTSLFLIFSKIGALAFGGGYPTLSLIQYEAIDRFHWLTTKEFLDGIALGQVTPGPILITATFIGYKLYGLWGALVATIGIFWPSFFILVLLIPYHGRLRQIEKIRIIEQGILGSFVGMLASVLYHFGKVSFVDIPTVLFAAAAFLALRRKIGLPYILLSGGILSIFVFGYLL